MSRSEPEIVHPVGPEAVPDWARAMATTFLRDPRDADADGWIEGLTRSWEPARAWGARVADRWVATLRTEPRMLTVPGAGDACPELPVDAVTNVTVAATHRRRGLMREMLTGSLQAARERGDAASVLIAAQWQIYGRFGYAPATLSADYLLDRRRPGAVCPGDPSRLRQVDRDEFRRLAPAVFHHARRGRAGQMDRAGSWWSRALGGDGYPGRPGLPHNWLVHEGDGGPDGLLAWTAHGESNLDSPLQALDVWLLASAGDAAYRNLWAYLTSVDLLDAVRLTNRPPHEPARWLLDDARTLSVTRLVDLLWLRLLDVPAALAARRYACGGEVVLDVHDDEAGFTGGRYRLAAKPGGASCERTDATADLTIAQRALASIYLGGFRLAELPPGSATELTPGALALVDLMFSTPLPPWNATWF